MQNTSTAQMTDSILARYSLTTSWNGKPKGEAFHMAHSFSIFVLRVSEDIKVPENAFYLLAGKGIPHYKPTTIHTYMAMVQICSLPPICWHLAEQAPSLPCCCDKSRGLPKKPTTITCTQSLPFLYLENLISIIYLKHFSSKYKIKGEINQKQM